MPSLLSDLSFLQDYFKKSFLGIISKFIPLAEEMFQGFQALRGRDSTILRVLLCRQPLLCYTVPSVLQAKCLLASEVSADCCEHNPDTSTQIPSQKSVVTVLGFRAPESLRGANPQNSKRSSFCWNWQKAGHKQIIYWCHRAIIDAIIYYISNNRCYYYYR